MPSNRRPERDLFPKARAGVRARENDQPAKDPTPGDEAGADLLRITVYATVDQLDHLDRDRILIRRATRRVLERTAIIRGLLEGYRRSGLDLAALGVCTEEELAQLIAQRLARREE